MMDHEFTHHEDDEPKPEITNRVAFGFIALQVLFIVAAVLLVMWLF